MYYSVHKAHKIGNNVTTRKIIALRLPSGGSEGCPVAVETSCLLLVSPEVDGCGAGEDTRIGENSAVPDTERERLEGCRGERREEVEALEWERWRRDASRASKSTEGTTFSQVCRSELLYQMSFMVRQEGTL